jgi:hypothetical protein
MLVLSLILGGRNELVAQQAPPEDQGWSQSDQNYPQYPQDQQSGYGQQPYPDQGYAQQGSPPSVQPLNAGQLEQLIAPIALYPDALVAQVLAATTYPSQIVEADRWRHAQGYAPPEQIAAGADAQNWDPSVKALTAFPQVLAQLDRNLQWTTDLGNAYYNQPQDVLEAVQVMRRRAQAAGNLQSTPQEEVVYDQGNIELLPPNPQVVYVPAYNPWAVYGEPVSPYPGFSLLGVLGDFFTGGPLRYGLGIAMSAFTHTPWGWLAWGLNWLTQSILFHQSDYYSHSNTVADWGFPHRGLHAYAGRGFARGPDHYARSWGGETWRHGGYGSGGWHSFSGESGAENRGARSNRGSETFRADRGATQGFEGNSFQGRSLSGKSFNGQAMGIRDDRTTARSEFSRAQSYHGPSSGRESENFSRSPRAYRGPTNGFERSGFSSRSSSEFAGKNYRIASGKSHSGGFHLFGGGHSEKSFSSKTFAGGRSGGFRGERAPKNFGGGKSFRGGHSHGGGHSGGHGGGHGGGHHR